MTQQTTTPQTGLRIAVLVVMLLVAVAIVWSVKKNTANQGPPAATAAPATQTAHATTQPAPATPASGTATASIQPSTGANQPVEQASPVPAASAAPQQPQAPATTYRASVFASDALATSPASLGSLDPKLSRGEIEFSLIGAGVKRYRLSEHFLDWHKSAHYTLQAEQQIAAARQPDGSVSPATLTPMAALGVFINESFVNLASNPSGPTWRQVAADRPGVFEAFVEDGAGNRVLRIERAYSVDQTHDVKIRQTITNLSAAAMNVRWVQMGPSDLPQDSDGYGGDRRRVPAGYLLSPTLDPTRSVVRADDFATRLRTAILGKDNGYGFPVESAIWPTDQTVAKQLELSWTAMTNRYFGAASHAPYDPAVPQSSKGWGWVEHVKSIVVNPVDATGAVVDPVMTYRLDSKPMAIAAGASTDISMGLWMGPLSKPLIHDEPVADSLGIGGMVLYNMGGPCAFCTFDAITFVLRHVMHFLHDYVFRDWSLAIIFLVVFVRTCLHPLTRWSQIRMQRFGKQMSLMQPKQKKLQERFKDDPKRLQQEMAALWREEGVSPLGMLGCLPMLLVTPIWLSLYALLFYAVELRNTPAFYGLIQAATNNGWAFLSDLSHPDAFIHFGKSYRIPVLSGMMGPISSFNILPILLGVVFFFHQKYLSPATSTQMTPEQEMQQKMVKIMSVVLFPVFMYNSPSGLALYFTTNSTLAIVENAWIRKHINKHGLLNEENLKKSVRKTGTASKGFLQRLMEAAEEKRKVAEAQARRDQLDRGKGKK